MEFKKTNFKSGSSDQTEKIGEEFSDLIKPGDVVLLKGNLGSGKTTFVKGFARGLGINSRIISPTFVVVREHNVNNSSNKIKKLYHFDLYRLTSEDEVKKVDLKNYIEDKSGVVVIEWPELSTKLMDKNYWIVTFEIKSNYKRDINIYYEK